MSGKINHGARSGIIDFFGSNRPYFLAQGGGEISSSHVQNWVTAHSTAGGAFVNSNGTFTCKVPGLWSFSYSVYCDAGGASEGAYSKVEIQDSNDAMILDGGGAGVSATRSETGDGTSIWSMRVGDTARIWCNFGITGSTPRNYFQGYLIG